jgi:hypothetical protein
MAFDTQNVETYESAVVHDIHCVEKQPLEMPLEYKLTVGKEAVKLFEDALSDCASWNINPSALVAQFKSFFGKEPASGYKHNKPVVICLRDISGIAMVLPLICKRTMFSSELKTISKVFNPIVRPGVPSEILWPYVTHALKISGLADKLTIIGIQKNNDWSLMLRGSNALPVHKRKSHILNLEGSKHLDDILAHADRSLHDKARQARARLEEFGKIECQATVISEENSDILLEALTLIRNEQTTPWKEKRTSIYNGEDYDRLMREAAFSESGLVVFGVKLDGKLASVEIGRKVGNTYRILMEDCFANFDGFDASLLRKMETIRWAIGQNIQSIDMSNARKSLRKLFHPVKNNQYNYMVSLSQKGEIIKSVRSFMQLCRKRMKKLYNSTLSSPAKSFESA